MHKSVQDAAESSHLIKKLTGSFYTPSYIVRHIVQNTLGRLCERKTPAEVAGFRILDPACGTGAFLLGSYRYLLDWHRNWYAQNKAAGIDQPIQHSQHDNRCLTSGEKQRILLNNIYGVDIDEEAVDTARHALLQESRAGNDGDRKDNRRGVNGQARIKQKIKCGNALAGFAPANGQAPTPGFEWPAEFPEVAGGFDAVIGNPPYGAALSHQERALLARKFPIGTTDTAALLMLQAYHLTKPGGWNGFIVPKPFTYSSNWKKLRALFQDDLCELTDVGKAWPEVKLEQAIYILQKGRSSSDYATLQRTGKTFRQLGRIEKRVCEAFGFYLNGVSCREVALANKMRTAGAFLSDFTRNIRGAALQGSLSERGRLRVIGGKQIRPFHLRGQRGFLSNKTEIARQARVQPGSILVQNIVAHINHPVERIQLIGAVAPDKESAGMAILDTVNQLTNYSEFSSHFLLALLSSRLVNWYVYHFIFAKAIRTLHFDGPVSRRIPIPNLHLSSPAERACHSRLATWAKTLAAMYAEDAAVRQPRMHARIVKLRAQIDGQIYQLYGLTPEEIRVVEEGRNAARENRP